MDSVDNEDGPRLFVDRSGLTRDLTEWCAVDHVLANVAPPKALVRWFERHPSEYAHFRAMYHDFLRKSRYRPSLGELAGAAVVDNYTLLHVGDDPEFNSAVALAEFLSSERDSNPRSN
ncbi:MAG TPA: DUF488 family protein [Tepidisphaeraceae bacterium]|nr:DUF488 family protein [Tepidisphaeraceae bacterium]